MNAPTRTILSLKRSEANGEILQERLHKVLANAGLGSRRLLETRIQSGEIKVNSKVAELGSTVRAGDRVELDGKLFIAINDSSEHAQVLAYHKPEGVITTRDDPEGRPTVFEQLPHLKGARWIAVGRLDVNTTGLLLLTTDGALAHALMHPSAEVSREYICRVHGEVSDETVERLRTGVELDDGPAYFSELAVISRGDSHSWFRIVLSEGRNREVRRMWESQGLMVSRLKRIRYGCVELSRGLRKGHSEPLDPEQVTALRESCGAGEPEQVLTLQPVIGQRRAKPGNEFRPEPRSQQAWTGGAQEETRELRAFDRIRDEPSGRRPKGKRPFSKTGAISRRNNGANPSAGPRRGPARRNDAEGFQARTWTGDATRPPRPRTQPRSDSHGNTFEANEGRPLHARSGQAPHAGRPGRPNRAPQGAPSNAFAAKDGRSGRRPFSNNANRSDQPGERSYNANGTANPAERRGPRRPQQGPPRADFNSADGQRRPRQNGPREMHANRDPTKPSTPYRGPRRGGPRRGPMG